MAWGIQTRMACHTRRVTAVTIAPEECNKPACVPSRYNQPTCHVQRLPSTVLNSLLECSCGAVKLTSLADLRHFAGSPVPFVLYQ